MSTEPLITQVHGRYYNLQGFSHPGGCPALECARNRDATALFESYHALHRDRPLQMLKRYEVAPEEAEADGRFLAEKRFGATSFDWEHTLKSAFRADLLACVRHYFVAEQARRQLPSLAAATKAPLRRCLEIWALGLAFGGALVFFVQGNWWALGLTPVLGWLFMVNFWHDALHFALSRFWRLNALLPYVFPWFLSPKLWMHQHVIGHHVFTNDPRRDPDLRAAPRVLRQTPGVAWCPWHAVQQRVPRLLVLYALVCLLRNAIKDHIMRIQGWFNDTVPLVFGPSWRYRLHIVGRLLVFWSLFVWPFQAFAFWKALAFALVPSMVLSELFVLFSQVNHITDANLEAAQAPSADWYEAQVRASCSYATGSYLAFLLSGGLNLQIEHHLLPGVNHYHLFRLSPEIRRICAQYHIPYHTFPSLRSALKAHFLCLKRLARQPAAQV